MTNVVVTYSVRPERLAEHLGLIEAVFEQLRAVGPAGLDYRVLRLADGVSFVHLADHANGTNPLAELPAFAAFTRDIADRVTAPPTASPASEVASYPAAAVVAASSDRED